MGAKRRTFSREFKLEAVRQLEGGRRVAEVAHELGIQETVLRRWRSQVAVDEEKGLVVAVVHRIPRCTTKVQLRRQYSIHTFLLRLPCLGYPCMTTRTIRGERSL